jgi:L-lactate dehydrogenase (cytochrome)
MIAASASDYRELARRRLPHFQFEYVDGGSYAEVTLRRNIEDLEAIALRQLVLRDVSNLNLSTEMFGRKLAMPVVLAPIGLGGINARRGEVQAARAAEAAGVPFTLSTMSVCGIDEVARGTTAPFWFQLYMVRDRAFMRDLLVQAREAGCKTLVFTVDLPVAGSRYRDLRSGLAGATGPLGQLRRLGQALARPRWCWDVGLLGRPHHLGNVAPILAGKTKIGDFFAWLGANFDPSVDWSVLDFVRSEWEGDIVVKGILDPEDAREAARNGVDGIVVSNHGGRQLDGVLSSARALPPIADAVGGQLTILADSGVRSGLDVVRMLALGAQGVMIGRAWVYGLAGGGQKGVAHVLRLIEAEMRVAMALTGATSIAQIDRSILA